MTLDVKPWDPLTIAERDELAANVWVLRIDTITVDAIFNGLNVDVVFTPSVQDWPLHGTSYARVVKFLDDALLPFVNGPFTDDERAPFGVGTPRRVEDILVDKVQWLIRADVVLADGVAT